jgi:outer membrane protein assembly factor BamB
MQVFTNLSIKHEFVIERAYSHRLSAYGKFFSLDGGSLLLTYNQEDKYNLNPKGHLAIIHDEDTEDIFRSDSMLQPPVVDDNGSIYIETTGYFRAETGRSDPATMYKFSPDHQLEWQYDFPGGARSLPVPYQDSVFVFDFIESAMSGRLNRIDKNNGKLIWRRDFDNCIWSDPWITPGKQQIVMGLCLSNKLLIMDMDGNIIRSIDTMGSGVGTVAFSEDKQGNFYASLGGTIQCFNQGMDEAWSYKPEIGVAIHAPVFDDNGFSYTLLNGARLAAIDTYGNELWVTKTGGLPVTAPDSFNRPNSKQQQAI